MKAKKILFYGLAVLLAGCGPIFSLHPLFTGENIVFEEKLLGTWADDPNKPNNTWEFTRLDEAATGDLAEELGWGDELGDGAKKFYRLNVTTTENDKIQKGAVVACLVKLQDRLFLDVFADKFPSGEQDVEKLPLLYNAFFFVPVHMFVRVDRAGNQLKLGLTDDEKFAKLLEAEPVAVKHEMLGDRPVLTASTKELQAFVLKHAGDEKLFANEMTLTRKSK
jgi:hypothetical protein